MKVLLLRFSTNIETKAFCRHKHVVPSDYLPLARSYYTCIDHEKFCIKSEMKVIFLRFTSKIRMTKAFCYHSNFVLYGLSALAQRITLMSKIMTIMYKFWDVGDILTFTANDWSEKGDLPLPQGYHWCKRMKFQCKIRDESAPSDIYNK